MRKDLLEQALGLQSVEVDSDKEFFTQTEEAFFNSIEDLLPDSLANDYKSIRAAFKGNSDFLNLALSYRAITHLDDHSNNIKISDFAEKPKEKNAIQSIEAHFRESFKQKFKRQIADYNHIVELSEEGLSEPYLNKIIDLIYDIIWEYNCEITKAPNKPYAEVLDGVINNFSEQINDIFNQFEEINFEEEQAIPASDLFRSAFIITGNIEPEPKKEISHHGNQLMMPTSSGDVKRNNSLPKIDFHAGKLAAIYLACDLSKYPFTKEEKGSEFVSKLSTPEKKMPRAVLSSIKSPKVEIVSNVDEFFIVFRLFSYYFFHFVESSKDVLSGDRRRDQIVKIIEKEVCAGFKTKSLHNIQLEKYEKTRLILKGILNFSNPIAGDEIAKPQVRQDFDESLDGYSVDDIVIKLQDLSALKEKLSELDNILNNVAVHKPGILKNALRGVSKNEYRRHALCLVQNLKLNCFSEDDKLIVQELKLLDSKTIDGLVKKGAKEGEDQRKKAEVRNRVRSDGDKANKDDLLQEGQKEKEEREREEELVLINKLESNLFELKRTESLYSAFIRKINERRKGVDQAEFILRLYVKYTSSQDQDYSMIFSAFGTIDRNRRIKNYVQMWQNDRFGYLDDVSSKIARKVEIFVQNLADDKEEVDKLVNEILVNSSLKAWINSDGEICSSFNVEHNIQESPQLGLYENNLLIKIAAIFIENGTKFMEISNIVQTNVVIYENAKILFVGLKDSECERFVNHVQYHKDFRGIFLGCITQIAVFAQQNNASLDNLIYRILFPIREDIFGEKRQKGDPSSTRMKEILDKNISQRLMNLSHYSKGSEELFGVLEQTDRGLSVFNMKTDSTSKHDANAILVRAFLQNFFLGSNLILNQKGKDYIKDVGVLEVIKSFGKAKNVEITDSRTSDSNSDSFKNAVAQSDAKFASSTQDSEEGDVSDDNSYSDDDYMEEAEAQGNYKNNHSRLDEIEDRIKGYLISLKSQLGKRDFSGFQKEWQDMSQYVAKQEYDLNNKNCAAYYHEIQNFTYSYLNISENREEKQKTGTYVLIRAIPRIPVENDREDKVSFDIYRDYLIEIGRKLQKEAEIQKIEENFWVNVSSVCQISKLPLDSIIARCEKILDELILLSPDIDVSALYEKFIRDVKEFEETIYDWSSFQFSEEMGVTRNKAKEIAQRLAQSVESLQENRIGKYAVIAIGVMLNNCRPIEKNGKIEWQNIVGKNKPNPLEDIQDQFLKILSQFQLVQDNIEDKKTEELEAKGERTIKPLKKDTSNLTNMFLKRSASNEDILLESDQNAVVLSSDLENSVIETKPKLNRRSSLSDAEHGSRKPALPFLQAIQRSQSMEEVDQKDNSENIKEDKPNRRASLSAVPARPDFLAGINSRRSDGAFNMKPLNNSPKTNNVRSSPTLPGKKNMFLENKKSSFPKSLANKEIEALEAALNQKVNLLSGNIISSNIDKLRKAQVTDFFAKLYEDVQHLIDVMYNLKEDQYYSHFFGSREASLKVFNEYLDVEKSKKYQEFEESLHDEQNGVDDYSNFYGKNGSLARKDVVISAQVASKIYWNGAINKGKAVYESYQSAIRAFNLDENNIAAYRYMHNGLTDRQGLPAGLIRELRVAQGEVVKISVEDRIEAEIVAEAQREASTDVIIDSYQSCVDFLDSDNMSQTNNAVSFDWLKTINDDVATEKAQERVEKLSHLGMTVDVYKQKFFYRSVKKLIEEVSKQGNDQLGENLKASFTLFSAEDEAEYNNLNKSKELKDKMGINIDQTTEGRLAELKQKKVEQDKLIEALGGTSMYQTIRKDLEGLKSSETFVDSVGKSRDQSQPSVASRIFDNMSI